MSNVFGLKSKTEEKRIMDRELERGIEIERELERVKIEKARVKIVQELDIESMKENINCEIEYINKRKKNNLLNNVTNKSLYSGEKTPLMCPVHRTQNMIDVLLVR
jgi:hypothetical protein